MRAVVSQKVEEGLHDSGHLQDVQLFHVQERFFPVLGHQRNVLLFVTFSDVRRIRSALAFISSSAARSLAILRLLVQSCAFGVVEHLGKEIPLRLLNSLLLLEFVHRLLTLLLLDGIFGALVCLGYVDGLVVFSVLLLSLHVVHLSGDIGGEVLGLDSHPFGTVHLGGVEGESNLFRGELTILS